jgi:hypothetical protein
MSSSSEGTPGDWSPFGFWTQYKLFMLGRLIDWAYGFEPADPVWYEPHGLLVLLTIVEEAEAWGCRESTADDLPLNLGRLSALRLHLGQLSDSLRAMCRPLTPEFLKALDAKIAAARSDQAFMDRIRRRLEDDRELYERLAQGSDGIDFII